jgi:flagellar basal-body rod protein FlgB
MSGIGLSVLDQMKMRMQWLHSRQKVLAENVSNSDLPKFKPKDLRPMNPTGQLGVAVEQTSPAHIASLDGANMTSAHDAKRFETVPSGNAVSLEDEMTKLAGPKAHMLLTESKSHGGAWRDGTAAYEAAAAALLARAQR